MSEISELEGRLVAAMSRIRTAVEANQASAPAETQELTSLESKMSVLEAERDAAQMAAETSQSALETAEEKLTALEAEMTELRETVQSLQSMNAELRQAGSGGDAGVEEENQKLTAELAALHSARAAELRDVEALLAQIVPSSEGAPRA